MTALQVIGWMALVFVGILLFCKGAIWLEKRFPSKQFDERQQRARGRACELGLLAGMVYFLATMVILLDQVMGDKTIEPYLLVYIGVMLQIMVMSTYSLLTYSYLSFLQKPGYSIAGFGFCGMLQFLTFRRNLADFGGLYLVGQKSFTWVPLLTGCCFTYLAVFLLIQQLRREKE